MEPVAEWDVSRVIRWFNQNGFPGYEGTLKEHSIDGEVLINLDHESLKDLGIRALGKRLLVLKSIYFLKLQHDIPITSDSYVPQTVDVEPDYMQASSYQRKQKRQTEENVSRMMEEISTLSSEINTIRSDMQRIYRLSILENKPLPAPTRQTNDPFLGTVVVTRRHQTSTGEYESRRESKGKSQSQSQGQGQSQSQGQGGGGSSGGISVQTPASASSPSPGSVSTGTAFVGTPTGSSAVGVGGSSLLLSTGHQSGTPTTQTPVTPHIRVYGDNALQRENEAYKSFRISADDPCSTILPHALKKYHIFDSWHNYSLCIQYGSSGKGKAERVLALDEKPLHLFQQLKDAGESPVFVLKKKNGASGQADTGSPHHLGVRGNTINGSGSRTSLFSLEHNNASSSSLDTPSNKGTTIGSSTIGNIPAAGSSTNEFEKIY
ncbi:hypothetical protein LPJ64_000326 [Coemansia asiatica]|uniref:RA-domain-containing protein n=1 Tax=Coemansia asiatica TaxID=1052880 RepID=A0A9W7XN80_9FUNG|nr:hypothetical protein LPJ64_000326 [Coemansia asiatica]